MTLLQLTEAIRKIMSENNMAGETLMVQADCYQHKSSKCKTSFSYQATIFTGNNIWLQLRANNADGLIVKVKAEFLGASDQQDISIEEPNLLSNVSEATTN